MIKKRILRICAVWLLLCLMTLQPSVAFAAYESTAGLELQAESAYIKCLTNGQTIYSKNADTPRHPASMTKLVTATDIDVVTGTDIEVVTATDVDVVTATDIRVATSTSTGTNDPLPEPDPKPHHFGYCFVVLFQKIVNFFSRIIHLFV